MTQHLASDELWAVLAPLLPPTPPQPKGGRPRVKDRAALPGILFVLRSGLSYKMLPAEIGYGSGMPCWRRLRDWHEAGVWQHLHQVVLERLSVAGQLDWSCASLDAQSIPAAKGGTDGS